MTSWINKKDKKSPPLLAIYWPMVLIWILIFSVVLLSPEDWPSGEFFPDWMTPKRKREELFSFMIWLFFFAIITPVIEELFFRKFLWGLSSKVCSFEGGHIVTFLVVTLLFALVHRDLGHIISVTPLSFFLGYVRIKTGSVKPCIVIHAVNNLSAALFPFLPLLWTS